MVTDFPPPCDLKPRRQNLYLSYLCRRTATRVLAVCDVSSCIKITRQFRSVSRYLFTPTNQDRQLRCDPYFEDRKPRKGITHAVSKGCHDCRARHRKCDVVGMVVVDVSVSHVELTCVSGSGTCSFLHSTQGAAALCRCLSRRPGETRPK